MQSATQILYLNLRAYKRKYYLNRLIKGAIVFFSIILTAYLLFNTAAFYGNFNTVFRGVFFFSFISLIIFFGFFYIVQPIYYLANLDKKLSDEEAARQIGTLLPEVKDKLLNTLQLSKLSTEENDLIRAGIAQKTTDLSVFKFADTIRFDGNKKYIPYLVPSVLAIVAILVFVPQLFTEGTKRIVQYNREFVPDAPFRFVLENSSLDAFKNEDLEVKLKITGESLPEASYIAFHGRKHKMEKLDENTYSFVIRRIDEDLDFKFEAAGFNSSTYTIDLKTRPVLNFFDVKLNYPNYLGKKPERLSNVGNLLIPQGTTITWIFDTEDCEQLSIEMAGNTIEASGFLTTGFEAKKQILTSTMYAVHLRNKHSRNKEKMEYSITVIPDEYPKISIDQYKDTTLFNYLVLGGNVSDDYGLTDLKLVYKKSADKDFRSIPLPLVQHQNSQSYYFRWDIDSLHLLPDESLEYYVSVWDNDGIHGHKSTKSKAFELKIPSQKDIEKSIDESSANAEQQISSTMDKAEQLKKEVKKLEQKLKSKKNFDWQDKKSLEDLLKKQEDLQKELEQLQDKHEELMQKQDRFDKTSERVAEKTKLLQQLMNDVLDEQTKKLYNELARLLQEKNKENEIKDVLDKIKNKEQNIEKDLDRALEMFKQLKFETKLDDIKTKLAELAQKQDDLSEKTNADDKKKDKPGDENKNEDNDKKETDTKKEKPDKEALKNEQEKLNKEFEEVRKDMDELNKMNEELENKRDMEETEKQEDEISQDQEKSTESLAKNDQKKAAKSQKKAAENMQKLQQKMEKMQQDMESKEMDENMEDLRSILENLITLSYDQEDVMKEFKKVNQQDPRFVQLSQKQLKLKDDSKIIEDSLHALAKRVFQIQSFITRELEDMNRYMDESSVAIKARRADMAAGKQQFAMTSMNNLALMLSDVLKQMQQQMKDQKPGGGSGSMKKKNLKQCKDGSPSLSQMQKKLNKQIEDLKKSGMSGRKLSEELSKLARQQEQIRNSMKEQMGQGMPGGANPQDGKDGKDGKNGQSPGQGMMEELKKEMEKTEGDLVNKRITQETLQRQQEILNRLLEHEKAQREREQDPKREAEFAKDRNKKIPPSFEQYLKEKERQVELLKTIPPNLNLYYKKEANEYFQKINEHQR